MSYKEHAIQVHERLLADGLAFPTSTDLPGQLIICGHGLLRTMGDGRSFRVQEAVENVRQELGISGGGDIETKKTKRSRRKQEDKEEEEEAEVVAPAKKKKRPATTSATSTTSNVSESKAKPSTSLPPVSCVVASNQPFAEIFQEFGVLYRQLSVIPKSISSHKVKKAISECSFPIRSGKEAQVFSHRFCFFSLTRFFFIHQSLPGVGKSSATKIDEFISTGRVQALEELRSKV